MNPSSDTKTHLILYRAFPKIASSSTTPTSPHAWLGTGRTGLSRLRHHHAELTSTARPCAAEPDAGRK